VRGDLAAAGSPHLRPAMGVGDEGHLSQPVIWGTTVSLDSCKDKFVLFVRSFLDQDRLLYVDQLEQIRVTGNYNYSLDCAHLASFDNTLYNDLVRYPQEVTPIFDMALMDMFTELVPDDFVVEEQIKTRPFHLQKRTPMRELNPGDVDSLVSIMGMVTRGSSVIPDLKQAFFECTRCRKTVTVDIDRGFIHEPAQCPTCLTRGTMAIQFNRCRFADRQVVKLQETPDAIPQGNVCLFVCLFSKS
jgi:DNA replication licensing factor MCM4